MKVMILTYTQSSPEYPQSLISVIMQPQHFMGVCETFAMIYFLLLASEHCLHQYKLISHHGKLIQKTSYCYSKGFTYSLVTVSVNCD